MIFKKNKYRVSMGVGIKIYRDYDKKFQAVLFKFGRYGFWFFTKEAYKNWPQCEG